MLKVAVPAADLRTQTYPILMISATLGSGRQHRPAGLVAPASIGVTRKMGYAPASAIVTITDAECALSTKGDSPGFLSASEDTDFFMQSVKVLRCYGKARLASRAVVAQRSSRIPST